MRPSNIKAVKPLTEEEKEQQLLRALGQKREEYAKNIAYRLCQSGRFRNPAKLIAYSVKAADALMDALFAKK